MRVRRHFYLRTRIIPAIVAGAVIAAIGLPGASKATDGAASNGATDSLQVRRSASAGPDSIAARDLIQSEELGRLLAGPAARRPALLHVGFKVLYRSGHIRGSRYVGPGSKPEGLDALRLVLRPMPRQAAVVLYCGCCPWKDCPNVLPAFRTARGEGFKDVKVLFVSKNLQHDWIDKGLPTSEGEP